MGVQYKCDHMAQFMHQNPTLLSAIVHACHLVHANPDSDPDTALSRPDIAGAINDADEFYSCVSDSATLMRT